MGTSIMIPDETVISKIYLIREQKVMLDSDLAELYQVETKALKQAVKRNRDLFPERFMFELTEAEFSGLRSQIVTSNEKRGGTRYLPMVFTEYGVLQLSNVLRSKRARLVSIEIIEVFVRLRNMLMDHTELRLALEQLERKTDRNTRHIETVFQYLGELTDKNNQPRRQVGFKIPKRN